jgi:hypothetical protein
MSADEKRLVAELAFYDESRAEWLKTHSGQYVVAQGENLLGFYVSFEEAFRAGVAAFGIQRDFLVKQVLAHEPIYFVF